MKYIVKDYELQLLTDEVRKSKEKLNELLADDFFEFTQSGGSTNKNDVMEGLPNSPKEKFEVRSYTEKQLSENNILVNYIADREVLSTGLKRCTLCSSIWQKINGKWQMIFFQGTPATK